MKAVLTRKETKTSYAYYIEIDGKNHRLYRGKRYTQYLKNADGTKTPVWFNEYLFPQFSEIPMVYIDDEYEGSHWEMVHRYTQTAGGASAPYAVIA